MENRGQFVDFKSVFMTSRITTYMDIISVKRKDVAVSS